jgi:hypothetical protein
MVWIEDEERAFPIPSVLIACREGQEEEGKEKATESSYQRGSGSGHPVGSTLEEGIVLLAPLLWHTHPMRCEGRHFENIFESIRSTDGEEMRRCLKMLPTQRHFPVDESWISSSWRQRRSRRRTKTLGRQSRRFDTSPA